MGLHCRSTSPADHEEERIIIKVDKYKYCFLPILSIFANPTKATLFSNSSNCHNQHRLWRVVYFSTHSDSPVMYAKNYEEHYLQQEMSWKRHREEVISSGSSLICSCAYLYIPPEDLFPHDMAHHSHPMPTTYSGDLAVSRAEAAEKVLYQIVEMKHPPTPHSPREKKKKSGT